MTDLTSHSRIRSMLPASQKSGDESIQTVATLVRAVLPVVDALVGVQCNGIVQIIGSVKGYSENPICCTGNNLYVILSFPYLTFLTGLFNSNGLIDTGFNSISLQKKLAFV
jgi:hypothetical protein